VRLSMAAMQQSNCVCCFACVPDSAPAGLVWAEAGGEIEMGE